LQMWLQTIWFLSRVEDGASVVLDEPDVYMHPDLQRRLIRYIRGKYPQIIIATHSVEIVADLDPSEILVIDRKQDRSCFADTLPAVQQLIENIGGVHNIHLARLWSSRRCILVEGDDLRFLKILHDKLYPSSPMAFDDIPNTSIGGWNGWNYAVGSTMFAQNALGQTVTVYCILDSDYHTPAQIKKRLQDAKKCQVQLHIWSRKEIENYFVVPRAIARIVHSRRPELNLDTLSKAISAQINKIATELRNVVLDAYATAFQQDDPAGGITQANRRAREVVEPSFENPETALTIVPGKEVIKQISSWLHSKYGRGISLRDILRVLRKHEIPEEVRVVIEAIERNRSFRDRKV